MTRMVVFMESPDGETVFAPRSAPSPVRTFNLFISAQVQRREHGFPASPAFVEEFDHLIERLENAVVYVGAGFGDLAQGGERLRDKTCFR